MKTLISALLLIPMLATAADNCVLQDRVVTKSDIIIEERSGINRDVIPDFGQRRRCVVDFRVRVGSQWHTAYGEHSWDGHRPESEACAIAVSRAEDSVRERLGRSQSTSEKILVCKDRPNLMEFPDTKIGTVGSVGQFRPHPEYHDRFWHNGTQCKWFVDTVFIEKNIRTFQGIICQIRNDRWVVVDKF